MWTGFPLFPEQGSRAAADVDALYGWLILFSGVFTILIFFLVILFAVRYRRRPGSAKSRDRGMASGMAMEIVWAAVPFIVTLLFFIRGAKLYFAHAQAPPDSAEVEVVGKQWMWKLQHSNGRREINELHLPAGRPVKLLMTSEDVIHSFYVPAFRVKQDVLPGRYTTLWFEPIRVGEYHLFCAEYCGTQHSLMTGRIVVMEPAEYSAWLGGAAAEAPAAAGEKLFRKLGCDTCHSATSGSRGPDLAGLFGKEVGLAGGGSVRADETYVRESIVSPGARIVLGYQPLMPVNYRTLIGEEGILQILAYIKTLGPRPGERGRE